MVNLSLKVCVRFAQFVNNCVIFGCTADSLTTRNLLRKIVIA